MRDSMLSFYRTQSSMISAALQEKSPKKLPALRQAVLNSCRRKPAPALGDIDAPAKSPQEVALEIMNRTTWNFKLKPGVVRLDDHSSMAV